MEKNPYWKNKYKINYPSLHKRIYRKLGQPLKCEKCGTTTAKRFEWANKTGKYDLPEDYIRLCSSCHRRMDGSVNNLLFRGKVKLKKKICQLCGKSYKPLIAAQRYCGSTEKKLGCSYIKALEFKRKQYHYLKNAHL